MRTGRPFRSAAFLWAIAGTLVGCRSDWERRSTDDLREVVRSASSRQLRDASESRGSVTVESSGRIESLGLSAARLAELDALSGGGAYQGDDLGLGDNLFGEETDTVSVGLQRVVQGSVVGNLGVQSARIVPSVSSAQVVQADAAFDWVLTGSAQLQSVDSPQAQTLGTDNMGNAVVLGAPAQSSLISQYQVGLRRNLITGGTVGVDWTMTRTDQGTPGFQFVPDPGTASTISLSINQPLLRGAGSGVARSEIRIARNAERRSISELRETVQDTVATAETAYWSLVQAQDILRIQRRSLDRSIETSEKIRQRGRLDATAAQIADALANVERRRANVIEAEDNFLRASDTLKAIVNDRDLAVGTETVLLPLDRPIESPFELSLYDAVTDAIRHRPEVRRALLGIDDASIRQFVSDNQRLPQLDLTFQASALALDDDFSETAFEPLGGEFFEYLLGLQFSRPIGNRAAEANHRATVLARLQSVIEYQATLQSVVLEVKDAMREVKTNYALIEQRRAARLAAAENLRALTVQIELTEGFTAGNLDLLLRRQESLAAAELEEIAAITGYNVALANLHAATGTNLERNSIVFEAPSPAEADHEG